MKKTTKIISLLLAVLLIMTAFSGFTSVFAAEEDYYRIYLDGLQYTECVAEIDAYHNKPTFNETYAHTVLSINGTKYNKGFSSHPQAAAPFILTYDIENAGFDRFQAYVGPDDVGYGAVSFAVLVDGVEVFSTAPSKKADKVGPIFVDVDLTNAKTVTFKETDGGDGYGGDAGCWGDACFLKKKTDGSVFITSPAPSAVYKDYFAHLSDTVTVSGYSSAEKIILSVNGVELNTSVPVTNGSFSATVSGLTSHYSEITATGYIGSEKKGSDTVTYVKGGDIVLLNNIAFAEETTAVRNVKGEKMSVGKGSFITENGFIAKGTGMKFNIGGSDYSYFSAVVGISDNASSGKATVKVLADGKEIYTADLTSGKAEKAGAAIPSGTKMLTLTTEGTATVNWCEAMVSTSADVLTAEGVYLADGLKKTKELEMSRLYTALKTTEDFAGVTFKTNGASGKATLKMYKWDYSCKQTLTTSPTVTAETEIKNGKAKFDLNRIIPAGEYLFAVEANGKINYYRDGNGSVYYSGADMKGIIDMSINFTASGADLLSETVLNGDLGYKSTKTAKEEKKKAEDILNGYLADMSKFPFSVKIGNTKYSGFGDGFTFVSKTDFVKHESKKKQTATYIYDHKDGLRFTLLLDYYPDKAAISWTIYIKNTSNTDSPNITDFYSTDIIFAGENPYIYTLGGCASHYMPLETAVNGKVSFTEPNGRSTENAWPYYNFQYGNDGVFLAIGWTGNWAADFVNSGTETNFRAYQKALNGYLKAGEEIRSPLVAAVYYNGRDYDRSVNVWRHFMIDCISVRDENGELMQPQYAVYTGQFTSEMGSTTEKQQMEIMETYLKNGIKLNYWWMDALWHKDFSFWQADTSRFPTNLKAISELAASHGMKTMLWFAPETTTYNKSTAPKNETDGTTLNPDWIIEGYATASGLNLMDMTNPDAVEFLKTRIIKAMEAGGIDIYREDMNYLPGIDWKAIDAADPTRSGVYENLYVQGRYNLWDGLRDHFPGLFIDTCASGGNRLDIETMSRANPLHRIDYWGYFEDDCARLQSQTMSLMGWLPYNGVMLASQPNNNFTKYRLRSSMTPWAAFATNPKNDPDWDVARKWQAENDRTNQYVYDDFYTLTDWSFDENKWAAYEYFSEDKKSGYAIAFRRDECDKTTHINFKGLDPTKNYVLTYEDAGISKVFNGFDLIYGGIDLTLNTPGSSEIIWITESDKAESEKLTVTIEASHSDKERKPNNTVSIMAKENGFYRFSLHLNMTLINSPIAKGESKTVELDGKYYDYFLIGDKKLSEIEGTVMKYDFANDFINFYIPSTAISSSESFDFIVSGDIITDNGIKILGKYTFTWHPDYRYFSGIVTLNKDAAPSSPIGWIIGGAAVIAAAAAAAFVFIFKKKKK